MTLGFSTELLGKPSYFVDRIIKSLGETYDGTIDAMTLAEMHSIYMRDHWKPEWEIEKKGSVPPKHHTIRTDPHGRWNKGNKIHFVIGNSTPKRFQFAPVVLATKVEKFEINWLKGTGRYQRGKVFPWIVIGDEVVCPDEFERMAQNDGFDTVEDFLKYFKKPFNGVIIHWTNEIEYKPLTLGNKVL